MHAKKLFIGWGIVLVAIVGLLVSPKINSRAAVMGFAGGGETTKSDTVAKAGEVDPDQLELERDEAYWDKHPIRYSRGMPIEYYDELESSVIAEKTADEEPEERVVSKTEKESTVEVTTKKTVAVNSTATREVPELITK